MSRIKAVIARHDAAERLTYALLANDQDGIEEARQLFESADELDSSAPDGAVRDAVIENDPVTAASVGWLTFPELIRVIGEDPHRYLTSTEAEAFSERGSAVLRAVVRSRIEGISFEDADKQAKGKKGDYGLAARGTVKDPRKLQRLLREQNLFDLDDQ